MGLFSILRTIRLIGERIALSITLLLAMTVFMLIVGEIIPPTSDSIPLVAIFFSAVMLEMVFMVIILCYILKLVFKTEKDEMPYWMKYYVLDRLSYTLGVRSRRRKKEDECGNDVETLGDKVKTVLELKSINQSNGLLNGTVASVTFVKNGALHRHGGDVNQTFENCFMNGTTDQPLQQEKMEIAADNSVAMRRLNTKLDIFLEKILHEEEADFCKQQWRICALTIDRLSLYLFGMIFLVTTLGIFMRAPGYVS